MSAAQAIASQHSTISEEEYAKLIPAETMFDDLRQMVHGFYQTKQLA